MAATRKVSIIFLAALLAILLISCADPATGEEDADEELVQEEIDPAEEEVTGEDKKESDTKTGTGTSPDSGLSHTVKMDINGEVKEGEGEGWWKDDDDRDNDQWWDED